MELKKEIHGVVFEIIQDPAPHHFAEENDPMMIYRMMINDELVCATDEGCELEEMKEVCEEAIQFFQNTLKFLKKKKQIGDRCT